MWWYRLVVRHAPAEDRRLVVTLRVTRVYGLHVDSPPGG